MIDSIPRREIRVSNYGTAWPYVVVPVDQLPQVCEKLDRHKIDYWVDPNSISLDGKPPVTFIDLGRSEDSKKIQDILDDVA